MISPFRPPFSERQGRREPPRRQTPGKEAPSSLAPSALQAPPLPFPLRVQAAFVRQTRRYRPRLYFAIYYQMGNIVIFPFFSPSFFRSRRMKQKPVCLSQAILPPRRPGFPIGTSHASPPFFQSPCSCRPGAFPPWSDPPISMFKAACPPRSRAGTTEKPIIVLCYNRQFLFKSCYILIRPSDRTAGCILPSRKTVPGNIRR